MRLGWYIARLRNMGVAEILHRVREKALKVRARDRLEGWDRYAADGKVLPDLPWLREALAKAGPDARSTVSEAAGRIMAGQFSTLGQVWPPFSFEGDSAALWHLDPATGQAWPHDAYCYDIGYRSAHGIGDVKFAWEFSRLQFLQPVAVHAMLADDAEALRFVERAIESWYDANPPFRGIGWSSGIELALRAISLLVVASTVGDRIAESTRRRIASILRAHAFWLERYPSRFSSANNHLVSEDAALFLLALAGGTLPEAHARKLVAEKRGDLAREAKLQLLADGVPAEQSPTYGALTAELILVCAVAARAAGQPLDAAVDERLAAYADHIRWLAEADGAVPRIGDDDEGRVLTLCQHEDRYPVSVVSAIAAHLGRAEFHLAHQPDLRNAVLPVPGVPVAPPEGMRSFREGGYTVHRGALGGRQIGLAIDHAPLGYLSIAAHGHADALSFCLTVDGKPLLTDPGTYLYHSGGAWRDWLRGTRAHNTLTLGGVDQSIIAGAFNWSHKANSRLDSVQDAPFAAVASHDGYLGRFGVRHVRGFAAEGDALTIVDRLEGRAEPQEAELVFQLAVDCTASEGADGAVSITRDGAPVAVLRLPPGGRIGVASGQEGMDGGWVSLSFGSIQAAPRISWTGPVGEAGVTTRLELLPAG